MNPILRALLVVGASIAGAFAVAGIASASGPLMPIAVTWPISGPVHVGQQVTIEANCPVLTTTPNGAPVFDSIVTLRWGSHVIWHQQTAPPKAPQAPPECVPTGDGGGCGWPNTGVCTGSVPYQVPAVFEVVVPSGVTSGELTALDAYGSVIAKGAVTVAGTKPSQPTIPTGTTPTGTHTTPKTPTHGQTKTAPTKPLTPHGTSATHLPWWKSLWDHILGLF